MFVMIASQGKTVDSQANPRFGRTPYFIKYDLEDQSWEVLKNAAINHNSGAGVAASQFIIDHGASIAISGRFGPNATQTLRSAGIEMRTFAGSPLTISEVIYAYENGNLKEIE